MEAFTTPRWTLAGIFEAGRSALVSQYGHRLQAHHVRAMRSILACRTGALGHVLWRCPDNCEDVRLTPRSCGHRSCPRCQNHTTTGWLERQREKLLPVDYFMLTFTLPAQLRPLARAEPHAVYSALFNAASQTIGGFASRKLQADIGQCAVLHTHSRQLDLHPHVHIIVPGGGIDTARKQWRKGKGKYLFNAQALARVFRAKLLRELSLAGLSIPVGMPAKWVVDCRNVGSGEPAFKYLSRYLYRGVIRDHDIVAYDADSRIVTFRYIDSTTDKPAYRQLPVADFLWRVLQHVLPTGMRRVRDYGFLHGNAKRRLRQVQLVMRVIIQARAPAESGSNRMCCPQCRQPMHAIFILARQRRSG